MEGAEIENYVAYGYFEQCSFIFLSNTLAEFATSLEWRKVEYLAVMDMSLSRL